MRARERACSNQELVIVFLGAGLFSSSSLTLISDPVVIVLNA